MKIDKSIIEELRRFPLYSQDGEKDKAIAAARLFLTGTAATFYILEADLEIEQLYGISNLSGSGWEYGYFSQHELESIDMYGGLVHIEADADFEPTPLGQIQELAEFCSELYGGDDSQE